MGSRINKLVNTKSGKLASKALGQARESLKLLETISAEKTRSAMKSSAQKLGISPLVEKAAEFTHLRAEVASLKDRVESLELQLKALLPAARTDHKDRNFEVSV